MHAVVPHSQTTSITSVNVAKVSLRPLTRSLTSRNSASFVTMRRSRSSISRSLCRARFLPLRGGYAVGVASRDERVAENEAIFRDANERIRDTAVELIWPGG